MMLGVLSKAMSILPKVAFDYVKFKTEAVNELGVAVPEYYPAVSVTDGMSAPVNATMIAQMGLQIGKEYRQFWLHADIVPAIGQRSNDYIVYKGVRYDVVQVTRWVDYDGWNNVVAVKVD